MDKARLMGSGLPALAVTNIGGTVDSAVTATGSSSQANSYALVADYTEVTTTAANNGVRLPANRSPGDSFTVYNIGASTLFLYPASGESINAIAADAKYDVATAKICIVTKVSPTRWAAGLLA